MGFHRCFWLPSDQQQFKDAYYFEEGVGTVLSDSGELLIDRSGKVLASGFDSIDLIADGRIPVRLNEKSGYLNLQGQVAIPFIYDGVDSFSGGLAAVQKGDKWGYVDREGNVIIPFVFDNAGHFARGLAPVKIGTKAGFIDKTGKFLFYLESGYYSDGFLYGDVASFWNDERKFGYVSTSGRVIWGPIAETPDHPPILGWSQADKTQSCEGISEAVKARIAGFPSN